jgi:hypothetical protein
MQHNHLMDLIVTIKVGGTKVNPLSCFQIPPLDIEVMISPKTLANLVAKSSTS